jgi:hypothetical protein
MQRIDLSVDEHDAVLTGLAVGSTRIQILHDD